MSFLDIHQLSYKYPGNKKMILDHFDLHLEEGEILAIVGESGSGKSTLLRLIAGLEKPYSGSIVLNREVLSDDKNFLPPAERRIGLVFQDFALFPHLNVKDNIAFGLRKNNPQRVKELLSEMQLSNFEKKYPHQLSGGEQQRVALARALILNPNMLMLDEPFSNLDTMIRQSVRNFVKSLIREKNITSILVTHDLEDAKQLAGRIVVLREGHQQQIGTWEEITQTPANDYVKALFKLSL
ncbi:MAG: ABC transporter ATP-binding protein [Chitinophagales bacterium]